MAVKVQARSGVFDGGGLQVRLERLGELLAVARLWIEQGSQAIADEAVRQERVLGQDQVGDHLVVLMHHRVGPQLAPSLERLLRLQV